MCSPQWMGLVRSLQVLLKVLGFKKSNLVCAAHVHSDACPIKVVVCGCCRHVLLARVMGVVADHPLAYVICQAVQSPCTHLPGEALRAALCGGARAWQGHKFDSWTLQARSDRREGTDKGHSRGHEGSTEGK